MKILGIVGGIGPEATMEYYRRFFAAYREQRPDGSAPAIVITSIDLQRLLGLIEAGALAQVTRYLVAEVERLARAGAGVGLLAANTPHIVCDDLQRRSPIPLVSIVEATCEAATALGLRRVGLFGTGVTRRGRFYPDVFARTGIALAVPGPDEQASMHEKYLGELVNGLFLSETRAGILAIVDRMRARDGIEGLILGGTELPLLLRDASHSGIPLLDTTRIHVQRALAHVLS